MILLNLALIFLGKWFFLEFILNPQPWLMGRNLKYSTIHSLKQGFFTFGIIWVTLEAPYVALGLGLFEAVLTLFLAYLSAVNPSPEIPMLKIEESLIPLSEKNRQKQLFKVQYAWKGLTIFILIFLNLFIAAFITFCLTH